MDGIHDLGGLEGFGPIDVHESDEPFHTPWEGRVMGMVRTMGRPDDWSGDWFRHCRELIAPTDYLTRPYYDQWLQAYGAMLVNSGIATVEELASGKSTGPTAAGISAPTRAANIHEALTAVTDFQRETTEAPRFAVGASVQIIKHGYSGHTRLPAYVRGRRGIVHALNGTHVLPDANAEGRTVAEPLYTIVFDARELWPEASDRRDRVFLDLWQSYFE